jgi:hypothetical protein
MQLVHACRVPMCAPHLLLGSSLVHGVVRSKSDWLRCCCCVLAWLLQDKPEALRSQLEALLQQQDIPYSYSKTSKFANFVNKTLM